MITLKKKEVCAVENAFWKEIFGHFSIITSFFCHWNNGNMPHIKISCIWTLKTRGNRNFQTVKNFFQIKSFRALNPFVKKNNSH